MHESIISQSCDELWKCTRVEAILSQVHRVHAKLFPSELDSNHMHASNKKDNHRSRFLRKETV